MSAADADPVHAPFGHCECRGCTTCGAVSSGPAAFEVVRAGRTMRVCTRCDLPSDQEKRLLVTKDDQAAPFAAWDSLGFMCIVLKLSDEAS